MKIRCPLCFIPLKEDLLYQDNLFFICPTKEAKGHKFRIMIVLQQHKHKNKIEPGLKNFAINILKRYITNHNNSLKKIVILNDDYASFPYHWHLVSCDLDSGGIDYEQIIRTSWLSLIEFDFL